MTATTHDGPIGGECACPLKPANAKGKRHSRCCFHDEPGITVCTCGAGKRDAATHVITVKRERGNHGE